MAVNFQEKRGSQRLKLRLPLRYQVRGAKDFGNVISDNISLSGVSFQTNRFIAPNTLITLEINLLSQILNPVARIARINSFPRSHRHQIGVEFLKFDPREKSQLANYLEMKKV